MNNHTKINTITVEGTGKLSVDPDYVSLRIDIERTNKNYKKSITDTAKAVQEVREAIITLGFDPSEVKTVNWNVEREYETVKHGGDFHNEFVGYTTSHSLCLEYDIERMGLGNIFAAFSECQGNPAFSASFTVKEKTTIEDQVLRDATRNAKFKAQIIAETAGFKLGNPIELRDGECDSDIFFESKVLTHSCLRIGRHSEADPVTTLNSLVPNKIDFSQKVTTIWEIEI